MCCSFTVHTYLFDDGVTITKETFSSCHLLLSYGLMVNFRIVLQCFKVRSCQYQKFSFFVSCLLKAVLLSSPLDFFFFFENKLLVCKFRISGGSPGIRHAPPDNQLVVTWRFRGQGSQSHRGREPAALRWPGVVGNLSHICRVR